jgi:hypothetical protein
MPPDRSAPEGLVEALAVAVCECGHLANGHEDVGCLVQLLSCRCRLTPAEALAPTVAQLIDAAVAQRTAHLVIEAERLREVVGRVGLIRDLHRPSSDHREGFEPYCVGCWEAGGMDGAPSWPCPTVRLLPGVWEGSDSDSGAHDVPQSAEQGEVAPEGRDASAGLSAAVRAFVQWVASNRAYNGGDDSGQEFYDRGFNSLLWVWAEEFIDQHELTGPTEASAGAREAGEG